MHNKTQILLLSVFLHICSYAQNSNFDQTLIAAVYGNLDPTEIAILLEHGADINAVDNNGFTPLLWASYQNNTPMTRFLLENGADASYTNKEGYTPILMAAQHGNFEMIVVLARYGATLFAQDRYGNNLLHYAGYSGKLDLVKFLLEQGIPSDHANYFGSYPVDIASKEGDKKIVDYYVASGAYIPYYKYNQKVEPIPDTTTKSLKVMPLYLDLKKDGKYIYKK